MRSARPPAVVLVLSVFLTAAGCSAGPGPAGPRAWASAVCTTLSPWRAEISALTSHTQQQMSAATTPAQAKENLIRMFAGARDASEEARAGVARAGVPDVDGGRQIAVGFTGSLAAVRDAYARAGAGIEALATAPAKDFYDRVRAVVAKLNDEYSASSLDTSKLSSPELKTAFDAVPECR